MSNIAIKGATTGTGVFTLESPATNTDRVLTLPDEAGTVLTSGGAIDVDASAPAASATIDSSGNLLVGKTASTGLTAGAELRSNGYGVFTRSGAESIQARRLSTNGDIVVFFKDTAIVGSIGTSTLVAGEFFIAGGSGLQFRTTDMLPTNSSGVYLDNFVDLGDSAVRFDDIYATNGTIQTSDRNEKQDIETLSEAETRVAVACKGLLRKFRWKDAVAEKGDEARIHFGIIAQDLQDAFAAEGLDAGRYAMFISSTWTDEETGEERTRLGVRYPELLAFIIGAL